MYRVLLAIEMPRGRDTSVPTEDRLALDNINCDDGIAGLTITTWIALTDGVEYVQTLCHLTEDSVYTVQVWCWTIGNEELAAVGVWTSICHRQHTYFVMLEFKRTGFVAELIAGTARACASWVAALHHEALDDTVEGGAIVESLAGKEDKVVDGYRSLLRKEFDLDITFAGMHDRGVFLRWIDLHLWLRLILVCHEFFLLTYV